MIKSKEKNYHYLETNWKEISAYFGLNYLFGIATLPKY